MSDRAQVGLQDRYRYKTPNRATGNTMADANFREIERTINMLPLPAGLFLFNGTAATGTSISGGAWQNVGFTGGRVDVNIGNGWTITSGLFVCQLAAYWRFDWVIENLPPANWDGVNPDWTVMSFRTVRLPVGTTYPGPQVHVTTRPGWGQLTHFSVVAPVRKYESIAAQAYNETGKPMVFRPVSFAAQAVMPLETL